MEKYLLPTEEVLIFTSNNSFAITTEILPEKVRIVDPKNVLGTKKFIKSEQIRLAIIDGKLKITELMILVDTIKDIRRKKKLNVGICIVNQDPLLILDTFWVQSPEDTKKYLPAA